MVKLAMATGQGSAIWPQGVTSITECPNDLVMALMHANFIIEASANLMEDEDMPDWKWAFSDLVQAHFERIKEAREKKFGGKKSSNDDADEPPGGWLENEYARNLR